MSASLPSVPACAPALSCARAAFRSLRASELAYLQSLPASHGMAQFAESLGGVHHVSQCLQVGLLLAGARPSVDFACGASPWCVQREPVLKKRRAGRGMPRWPTRAPM